MLTGEFSSACSIIIDFSSYFYFRRLVTNILLSFLTTSRGDPKRFEMLALLATILSWDDAEREKAGLQRQGAMEGGGKGKAIKGKDKESEKNAEEEAAMNEVSPSHQPATRFYWHICVELNMVPDSLSATCLSSSSSKKLLRVNHLRSVHQITSLTEHCHPFLSTHLLYFRLPMVLQPDP